MTKPKSVLITGCSSGIGQTSAELLAQLGHTVYATARSLDSLSALRARIESTSGAISTAQLDVTDQESIEAALSAIRAIGAGLDVVVNNAGYGQFGAIEDVPLDRWRRQFEVNLFGTVAVTQAALPLLRESSDARIVNVSSTVAYVTTPLMGVYNASKYAVRSMSAALRMELRGWGIPVIEVEPGAIASRFRENVEKYAEREHLRTEHYRRAYAAYERGWERLNRAGMTGPAAVARAIQRAVDDKRPRRRYRVTFIGKLLPAIYGLVPERLMDRIMLRSFGVMGTLGRRRREP